MEKPVDQCPIATDEAIAVCGGDARAAVKALLIAILEDEQALAVPAVSFGYSKGWHSRRRSSTS